MQKTIYFLLMIVTVGLYTSCKSNKELTYLSDIENEELQEGIPAPASIYRLRENDNLYVDIQTMNPEINALFNPAKGTGFNSGTQQNYGDLSSQYLNGFQVNLQGEIEMPILGSVKVIGKTLEEAREMMQVEADKYIKDATIKLKLLNYKITIMGEVKRPGVYYNYNSFVTVLDGISMASGETDYSSIDEVLVLRQTEKGTKSYRIDMSSGKKFLQSEAYYLQPNDVVYVEPDNSKKLKINLPVYTLILSSVSTLILLLNYIE
ncbi:polysaccharide biosynthesis/export family protein [Labilibacter marinus]|uniref:polysaccharide biosynthesis/export family protein n=1 Tax=Labilibacter marinus TaxID=1477105 RepID=UPI00082F873D|nr:polysaccharide biosynthesis/export family protein [Labilibacter marinus]